MLHIGHLHLYSIASAPGLQAVYAAGLRQQLPGVQPVRHLCDVEAPDVRQPPACLAGVARQQQEPIALGQTADCELSV
jgi:hypothetical protein